jgi:DNA-binding transcriptional ArsR family regulator
VRDSSLLIVHILVTIGAGGEMAKADPVEAEDGRLCAQLAARLDPKVRDALDHPIRRELLRTLNGREETRSVVELGVELRASHLGELSYHLQVLERSGTVTFSAADRGSKPEAVRYASAVNGDVQVRAVLRATEPWDRKRREAVVAAKTSPLLTMFRIPRPVRTIRLRGRSRIDTEQGR